MTVTTIGICNSALIKLGGRPITSMSDSTRNAVLCCEQFEKVRDALLGAHRWTFVDADLDAMPPAFREALAWALANDLAYMETGSLAVARNARRNFLFWFAIARMNDGARGFWLFLRTVI